MNTTKYCPASGAPRQGEEMKRILVDGEYIDISSNGCYFDQGELVRILDSKPSFIQNVWMKLSGSSHPSDSRIHDEISSHGKSYAREEEKRDILSQIDTLEKQIANLQTGTSEWRDKRQKLDSLIRRLDQLEG